MKPTLSILTLLGLLAVPTAAFAVQATAADGTVTHNGVADVTVSVGTGALPADLEAPDNYAGGTLHHRVTVVNRPAGGNATTYQACFVQGANRACTDNRLLIDADTGTFETTQAMLTLTGWDTIDWTAAIDDVEVTAMDSAGEPIDANDQWIGAPDAALYYPLEVTYQAVVVANGSAFEGYPGEMMTKTPAPSFSPGGGQFQDSVSVTLAGADPAHAVYYTTDGSDPDDTSTAFDGTPIELTTTTTLKAIAVADQMPASDIVEATYEIVDMLPNGLRGRYYSGRNFGNLEFERTDQQIDFTWDGNTPQDIGNPFSVIWTGRVIPRYSDDYTFQTRNDDGVRLWVNDRLIIDDWNDHGPQDRQGNITLQQGVPVSIWLEYYNGGGPGTVTLSWVSDQQGEETIGGTSFEPALVGSQEASVTLLNDVEQIPEADPSEYTVEVRRRGNIDSTVSVPIVTGGTATNGEDYTGVPGNVAFAPGELSKRITLTVVDDEEVEGEETIELSLMEGDGYSVSDPSTTTIAILDNDIDEQTIAGTIQYTGEEKGVIVVEAFREEDQAFQKRRTVLQQAGPFQIIGAAPGEYQVIAFIDSDGDTRLTDGEVWGQYVDSSGLPATVTLPPAATGVVINLDLAPGEGPPDEGDGGGGGSGEGGCCATAGSGEAPSNLLLVLLGLLLVRGRRSAVRYR